uniref:Uncharacterized protein n=1 Tax=Fagus sylvatica TaxID=28930 RepID=A0A2N9HD49_FAGSY
MMFLLSSACSTQRKGKETYWCTCCPIKAQFGLRARHVHWAVKGHLGLFIALLGSSSFSSDMFGLGQIQLGSFKPSQSPMSSVCSASPKKQTVKLLLGLNCSPTSPICSSTSPICSFSTSICSVSAWNDLLSSDPICPFLSPICPPWPRSVSALIRSARNLQEQSDLSSASVQTARHLHGQSSFSSASELIFLGSFEPVLFQFRLLRILFMASTTLPRFGVGHGSSQHP